MGLIAGAAQQDSSAVVVMFANARQFWVEVPRVFALVDGRAQCRMPLFGVEYLTAGRQHKEMCVLLTRPLPDALVAAEPSYVRYHWLSEVHGNAVTAPRRGKLGFRLPML